MGCDIHIAVEIYDPYANTTPPWVAMHLWEDQGSYMVPAYCGGSVMDRASDRNYRLFTVLAGVRDYGDEAVVPIEQPRGIPADAGKCIRQWVEGWGSDGHSHSYYTLAELLAHRKEIAAVSDSWDHLIAYLEEEMRKTNEWSSRPLTTDHIRVVFFFDN